MYSGLVTRLLLVAAFVCVVAGFNAEERRNAAHIARQDTLSPDSTTAAPPSATSPIIIFQEVPDMTACSSGSISWLYVGPSASMNLVVSNISVLQTAPPSSSSSASSNINTFTNVGNVAAVPTGASIPIGASGSSFTIVNSLDVTSESYTWNPVNVSQGWYVLYAAAPEYAYFTLSPRFFVGQGSDTSCLSAGTSGISSSGPSSTGGPTSQSSSSPATSSSSVAVPVGGASTTSTPKVGVIVGVVVGGTALLTAVILAYFCLQRKGKISGFKKGSVGSRGWGGLGSVDNIRSTEGSRRVYSGGRSHSQADSVGPIVTGSDEAFSPSVEKFSSTSTPGHGTGVTASPFDDAAGAVLSTLPGLGRTGSGKRVSSRSYSYSSTTNSHGGYPSNEYTPASSRRPSMPESVSLPPGAGRQSLDSNTYPPPSPAYPSGTSAALYPSITAQSPYYNPYINSELARSQPHTLSTSSNIQESSSSQVQIATSPKSGTSPGTTASRKTPRKPVPVYDPNSVFLQESTVSLPSPASERSPAESTASHDFFNVIGGGAGSQGHYTTRTNSQPGARREPALQHKSSFGPGGVEGKPMHLLIPDMPLELKD